MARKKFSSFVLGLFVTGGFLILAAVLIWIGATQYFERGKNISAISMNRSRDWKRIRKLNLEG